MRFVNRLGLGAQCYKGERLFHCICPADLPPRRQLVDPRVGFWAGSDQYSVTVGLVGLSIYNAAKRTSEKSRDNASPRNSPSNLRSGLKKEKRHQRNLQLAICSQLLALSWFGGLADRKAVLCTLLLVICLRSASFAAYLACSLCQRSGFKDIVELCGGQAAISRLHLSSVSVTKTHEQSGKESIQKGLRQKPTARYC